MTASGTNTEHICVHVHHDAEMQDSRFIYMCVCMLVLMVLLVVVTAMVATAAWMAMEVALFMASVTIDGVVGGPILYTRPLAGGAPPAAPLPTAWRTL